MDMLNCLGMLADAGTKEGSPWLGLLMIGGIVWFLIAVFSKKKDKYVVTRATSVRKVK